MDDQTKQKNNLNERGPIVAVMGHIDHGKSALLDYIRKSNTVGGEAGGITQHISAYEVIQKTKNGEKKITFLDTPGHSAFTAMRARGASVADIAILIISAEEGPKPQTLEAYESIKEAGIPFIVAINKIDKPEANIEKTKQQLVEKEIYVEGYGGEIPWVAISAKTGEGIPELLETIALVAEMEELTGDLSKKARGFILEANLDPQKGICATVIITDGTLKIGDFIINENQYASIKTINDFKGKPIREATFSSPVQITGFKKIPNVGSIFNICNTKKEADEAIKKYSQQDSEKTIESKNNNQINGEQNKKIITIIIKADVLGSIEAIEHEINKIENERTILKIISKEAGNITENDVKNTGGGQDTIIVGFNVKIDKNVKDLAEKKNVSIGVFDIIYKLTEWLEEETLKRTPKIKTEETIGKAKILKIFSQTKDKIVLGGDVLEGFLSVNANIKISRRDFEIGKGKIIELQSQKIKTKEVREGEQFGAMVESKKEIAQGDIIEAFVIVEK